MHTTWILVADSSRARIFAKDRDEERYQEIEDFANPVGHEDDSDVMRNQLGRFRGRNDANQAHTATPETDPVEHRIDQFSKSLGDYLDKACLEKRYESLRVIAPPRFLGHIRDHLGEHARQHLEEEIAKDFSWYEQTDIEGLLSGLPRSPHRH